MVYTGPAPSMEKTPNGKTEAFDISDKADNTVIVQDGGIPGIVRIYGFDCEEDAKSLEQALSSLEIWWVHHPIPLHVEISVNSLPDAMDIIHGMGYFTENRRKR